MDKKKIWILVLLGVIVAASLAFLVQCMANARGEGDEAYRFIYEHLKDMPLDELEEQADAFYFREEYDSTLVCYTMVAEHLKNRNDKRSRTVLARAYNRIGHIFMLKSDYASAYESFLKALEVDDPYGSNLARIYISIIYSYYGDYEQAMNYGKQAYSFCLKEKDYVNLLTVYHNVIDEAFMHDQLLSEMDFLRAFRDLENLPDTPIARYEKASNRGMIAVVEADYARAISCFKEALSYVEEVEHWIDYRIDAYRYIGHCHAMSGRFGEAVENMQYANCLAREDGYMVLVILTTKSLADFYKMAGNDSEALHCEFRYLQVRDSVFSMQNLKHITEIRVSAELAKVQENYAQVLLEKQMQARLLYVAGVVIFLIVIGLVFIVHQYRRIKQSNQALFEKNLQLMGLQGMVSGSPAVGNLNPERMSGGGCPEPLIPDSADSVFGQLGTMKLESVPVSVMHPGAAGNSMEDADSRTDSEDALNERVFAAVSQAMEDSEAWCDPDFSLEQLSDLAGYNSKYVSKAINDKTGKNFRTFLNEYRIREASRRLLDRENSGRYTNEYIGELVGFRSRSTFNTVFKKITGLTPKEYQHQAGLYQNRE